MNKVRTLPVLPLNYITLPNSIINVAVTDPRNRNIIHSAKDLLLLIPNGGSTLSIGVQAEIINSSAFKTHHLLVLKADIRKRVSAFDGTHATVKPIKKVELDVDLARDCKRRILEAAYYALPVMSIPKTEDLMHYLNSLAYLPLCEFVDSCAPYLVQCPDTINELAVEECAVGRAVYLEAHLQDTRTNRELEKLSISSKYHH